MHDSVPSARYSPVCNVLRQWKTSLIPTYRVYRLYDNTSLLLCDQCTLGSTLVKMTIRQMALGGCHEVCLQNTLSFKGIVKEPCVFTFLLF